MGWGHSLSKGIVVGENQFVGQKVVELVMDSGETVYVKPLSIPLLYAIMDKSAVEYPYPDPKPYEKALDDSITFEPGQVLPAGHNEEYRALCAKADDRRRRWQNVQIVLLCVQVEDKQALLDKYGDTIEDIGKIVDVPEDAWEAVLLYCILSSVQDYNQVVLAANGSMVVTEEAVRGTWRIFQPEIRRSRPVRHSEKKGTPGIEPDDGTES
jgi:hypothetical protein